LRHHPPQLGPNNGIGVGAVTTISLCVLSSLFETRQIEISIRSGVLQQDSGVGVANDKGGLDTKRFEFGFHSRDCRKPANSTRRSQRPRNFAARFARKAAVPSALSSVEAHTAKSEPSRARPSDKLVSMPLFTASSANFIASGALAAICRKIVSARASKSAWGTISLTRPTR